MAKALPKKAAKPVPDKRYLLNIGCGAAGPERLPVIFHAGDWHELRVDIDADVQPHLVADALDLKQIPDACMDAVWSSHNLEHLHAHEVPIALAEFKRVLKPDGFFLVTLPNLRALAHHIINETLDTTLYQSQAGPITPLDIIYGHGKSLAAGNDYMAHRTGFTAASLNRTLHKAGFAKVRIHEGKRWDLWAIGTMPDTPSTILDELVGIAQ